jgi:hypothetical protein
MDKHAVGVKVSDHDTARVWGRSVERDPFHPDRQRADDDVHNDTGFNNGKIHVPS